MRCFTLISCLKGCEIHAKPVRMEWPKFLYLPGWRRMHALLSAPLPAAVPAASMFGIARCLPTPNLPDTPLMQAPSRWFLALAGVAGVAAATSLALAWWMPSDEALAQQLAARASQAAGLQITVGSLHWQLWPTPRISLTDVATDQQPPIVLRNVTLWPRLRPLLNQQLALQRVEVSGGQVPQLALPAFKGREPTPPGAWKLAPVPLEHLQFDDVTWIDRRSIALPFAGEVDFDAGWRPRTARLERPHDATDPLGVPSTQRTGPPPHLLPATLQLTRTVGDPPDRWTAEIAIGGGRMHGEFELQTDANNRLTLTGKLQPDKVEISAMLAAAKRHSPVTGIYSGVTRLSASGSMPGELARSLHTTTPFTMTNATLHGFDLAKAVRTAGITRGGQTRLDRVTGRVDTQNSATGAAFVFTNLKATSGVLTASANAVVKNRQIEGDVSVDVVDGLLGVPLHISGPVAAPTLSLTGAAAVGAAVGTAVAPGLGTVVGARIGDTLGRMLGGGSSPAPSAAPSRKAADKPPSKGPRAP